VAWHRTEKIESGESSIVQGGASVVIDVLSVQSVPLRALTLSLMAMTVAVTAAVFWPEVLLDQEVLAGGLALIPALLLAHYRGWSIVSILLGVGLVALTIIHLSPLYFGVSFRGPFLILFVVAPYIAIALGAGWFGEVRRYQDELRATQLQLIQSEKLDSLGRMAAGVAHEVKNPLMMILTGVKILSQRLADADESTRLLLQDMTDSVERADKVIGGLLNYSRDRGLDVAPADLNATIEKSLLLVKHELDKARIRVAKDLDGSLPMLQLDEFKIQQVFVNLLANAIHAIGCDGEINLRTSLESLARGANVGYRRTDRYAPGERVAVIRIEDSGPGISEEHLKKVFDPFFTTKPTGRGTGLGLSVSRQIVDMHGGTIEIGNRDVGGARVTIILKLKQKEDEDEEATDPDRR
jgi:signal transduction histidine kinase